MTADTVGGVWQYSLDLLTGFANRNCEVLLATLGPPPSRTQREQLAAIPNVRLEVGEFALEWMEKPWADVDRSSDWLVHLAAEFRPDVVHLNGYSHAGLPWKAPCVVVAHSCVYSWYRAVHNSSPGAEWTEYRRRVIAGLAAADSIVTPSHYMSEAISTEYGVPIGRIRVIHNSSTARMPEIGCKHPFILAAGRLWDPAKNINTLVEAAPRVSWEICVAGPSNFERDSLDILGQTRWLGNLPHEQLINYMGAAAIFAHPAVYEPFGLSVLEAAKAGCALVLSDIPPMRELWENAAVFVDPHDPNAWVTALNRLAHDHAHREQLGYLARRRALEYSHEQCISSYLALYEDMLRLRPERAKDAAA